MVESEFWSGLLASLYVALLSVTCMCDEEVDGNMTLKQVRKLAKGAGRESSQEKHRKDARDESRHGVLHGPRQME